MKNIIGRLYIHSSENLVVLCTGEGNSDKTFSGVIVHTEDNSTYPLGFYNQGWSSEKNIFKEHSGNMVITFPKKPKRICANCSTPVEKRDKWAFREDGRIQHRNCNDKTSYRIETI